MTASPPRTGPTSSRAPGRGSEPDVSVGAGGCPASSCSSFTSSSSSLSHPPSGVQASAVQALADPSEPGGSRGEPPCRRAASLSRGGFLGVRALGRHWPTRRAPVGEAGPWAPDTSALLVSCSPYLLFWEALEGPSQVERSGCRSGRPRRAERSGPVAGAESRPGTSRHDLQPCLRPALQTHAVSPPWCGVHQLSRVAYACRPDLGV